MVIFDHTVRVENGAQRHNKDVRAPVHTVHNDYTERSGPQRVRDLLDVDDAETFLNHRFAVVNVWRSIGAPIETAPLAIADAKSVAPEDFLATSLVRPDRVGEIYQVAYNSNHRWFYFPKTRRDEALLIKCYDSATNGPARFTAHTAFDNPTAPRHALPRESIEVRTLISYAPEFSGKTYGTAIQDPPGTIRPIGFNTAVGKDAESLAVIRRNDDLFNGGQFIGLFT